MKTSVIGAFAIALVCNVVYGDDFSEAVKDLAEARDISLSSIERKEKLRAESVLALAKAQEALASARLSDAKRSEIAAEIARLRQKMRISEYEFQRIIRGDWEMVFGINKVREHINLSRSLYRGLANWRTWTGVDQLILGSYAVETITQLLFDTQVEPLPRTEFVSNSFGVTHGFPGGNLGELQLFVKTNNYSFRPFGKAHQAAMKILNFVSAAAELEIRRLRDLNQSIRLTVADIP